MSSIQWSHSLRIARPFGLLSTTRTQLQPIQSSRISLPHHGHQPGTRSFHLRSMLVVASQVTQETIIHLHSVTHIPWFLWIPCVSLGISLVFRLPSKVYTRRITQRRATYLPVIQAWSWRIQKNIAEEKVWPSRVKDEIRKRYKDVTKRIYRNAGLQEWKLYTGILSFPFWIIGIDCIRRICGGPKGIVGNILTRPSDAKISGTQETVQAATSQTDNMGASIDGVLATATENIRNLPDPSITWEGCLWFTDLSVSDPYHILPTALSTMLVINLLPKTKKGIWQLLGLKYENQPVIETQSAQIQLRLRRIVILLSAMIGPLTADLPAALHLYWLTSAVMHAITDWVMSRLMPIKARGVERCQGTEYSYLQPKPTEKQTSQTKQEKATK
ncbi:uncharacterized protein F4822DRAFT_270846 [Hypoxylon trugodes]|uniref:uncharacterized protein n=1 Tax=Hypoxylon trugodes TaxID=326681 RepID=UPI002198EC52|nr:uncharacterized protein F4822DRAFT_270846 [Hypoxylon trugodes]KAI1389149.1 hypothetical protein F4822DRAFT_270846 [Hypoxylon trugodes]